MQWRAMRERLRRTAPIPIRHSSSIVQPWSIAMWPTVTRAPTWSGMPSSVWTTQPSWMFDSSPIETRSLSPRRTELNHTLESLPRTTRPTIVAFGAMNAARSVFGISIFVMTVCSSRL